MRTAFVSFLVFLAGLSCWAQEWPQCARTIDGITNATIEAARFKAEALAVERGCSVETTRGEVLQSLLYVIRLNRSFGCEGYGDESSAAVTERIKKDSVIAAGLKDYLAYRFLIAGIQLQGFGPPDPAQVSTLLVGTHFYLLATTSDYSPWFKLEFQAGGKLLAQQAVQGSDRIDTLEGTWALTVEQDPEFVFVKRLVATLHAGEREEKLLLENEGGGLMAGVQLKKPGQRFDDFSGWANEVRACLQ